MHSNVYCERYHWVYLHGHTPILIDGDVRRQATLEEIAMVALCAQILIYECTPPTLYIILVLQPRARWFCCDDSYTENNTSTVGEGTREQHVYDQHGVEDAPK